jgi:hypothetical protein
VRFDKHNMSSEWGENVARVRFFALNVALFIEKFTLADEALQVVSSWIDWNGAVFVSVGTRIVYMGYRAAM